MPTITWTDFCSRLLQFVAAIINADLYTIVIQFMPATAPTILCNPLQKFVGVIAPTDLYKVTQKTAQTITRTNLCPIVIRFVVTTIDTDCITRVLQFVGKIAPMNKRVIVLGWEDHTRYHKMKNPGQTGAFVHYEPSLTVFLWCAISYTFKV